MGTSFPSTSFIMNLSKYLGFLLLLLLIDGRYGSAQAASDSTGFPPLDQWRAAILAADASALKTFYSADPPAQISANGENSGAGDDVNFWLALKARSIKIEVVRLKSRPDAESVIFKAEVQTEAQTEAQTGSSNGARLNVTDAQGWKNQAGHWRIVGAERTDAPQLKQPSNMAANIYPPDADAHAEIKAAEEKAAAGHQRVLLIFGANWCYDCHVLDLALHRPDFQPAVKGYEIVHVDIGDDGKKNADVAREFDVPLDKGVPVLAVIEPDGKIVVSQKNGEFEDARALTPAVLLEFLNKWKLQTR